MLAAAAVVVAVVVVVDAPAENDAVASALAAAS